MQQINLLSNLRLNKMKKLLTFIALAALFITTASPLTAQNRSVLKNSKGAQKVVSGSENVKVLEQNGQYHHVVAYPEIKPQAKGNAPTHTLNIYPPMEDDWQTVWVSDGVDMVAMLFNGMGDHLTVDLEEGTYYVESTGSVDTGEDFFACIWTLDGLELNEDTEVNIDYNDCVYGLTINAVDEDGRPLSEMDYLMADYEVSLYWLRGVLTDNHGIWGETFFEEVPLIRLNGFDEHSVLCIDIDLAPGDNKSYVLQCQTNNMHENQVFTVNAEDLETVQSVFTVKDDSDTRYYHTDFKTVINGHGGWFMQSMWDYELQFDPAQPYTVVTNVKVEDPSNFEPGVKTILMPTVYEWYDLYGFDWPQYDDFISTSLYLDAEGNAIREAMPNFRDGEDLASWPNYFPETPARTINPSSKKFFFGERTPLAMYCPVAFNADNTPLGQTFFYGRFFFSGEQSCERTCDYDSFIHVYIDGQEVYNDSIYKFNWDGNSYQLSSPTDVVVDVNNKHLLANDVYKVNKTTVEFSLENADAIPPTMTFMRVLDGNGDENIWIDRPNVSTLVFGCADFTHHFTEDYGGYYDHLEYNGKPEVELSYSLDDETWVPLVFAEDEGLFHADYGNVFVAELSQLETRALDEWVSLKFVLTDEAGNSQTQVLEKVFYAGAMISVGENGGLKHQVYPNPFTGEVRITTGEAVNGNATIDVYNVLGAQVYHKAMQCAGVTEFVWEGSQVPSGVYFYSIRTEGGVLQGRIVKE